MALRNGLRGKAANLEAQPSLHTVRSWKRHQARMLQEATIEALQKEFKMLKQVWWSADYCWIPVHTSLEERARTMIAPLKVHRERCRQKGEGADEQRLRQAANRSKHDTCFVEHVKAYVEFDPFSFLGDMANDKLPNMWELLFRPAQAYESKLC